jgi:hypothetical protein
MQSKATYQELSNSYVSQIRDLFLSPEDVGITTQMRSGSAVTLETLVQRAETLADTSLQLGEATTAYLSTDSKSQQEVAEMKLLAQAIAELETAQTMLESASEAQRDIEKGKMPLEANEASRSMKVDARIQKSIEDSAIIMETPLEDGVKLLKSGTQRSALDLPTDINEAKEKLKSTVEFSMKSICKNTGKVGGRAIGDLFLMDAAVIRQGIEFVSKDAAQLIDKMVEGVGSFIVRLVQTAMKLLGQAYNWIRTILGQDIEEEARKKVGGWVDDLKQSGSEEGLFSKLIPQIYNTAAIQSEFEGLLESTQADVAKVNQATEVINSLAERYEAKTKQVERLLIAISFMNKIPALKLPQGQLILAAVTLSVASYVLYLGNDHIRDGQVTLNEKFSFNIPDRVVGVRETVQQALRAA